MDIGARQFRVACALGYDGARESGTTAICGLGISPVKSINSFSMHKPYVVLLTVLIGTMVYWPCAGLADDSRLIIPGNPAAFSTGAAGSPDAPEARAEFATLKRVRPADSASFVEADFLRNGDASTRVRLQRAELLSLSSQLLVLGLLQAGDAWHTGHRPFSDARDSLRRAWTKPPLWDEDSYFYNYIGHPYTGAFTYNLMRSQKASPLASWLFSCSQSLIWEFTFEATEQHPSIQDLLLTSNVGSLMGEGFHRLTGKMRKNGLSRKEKILLLLINPGHVLNNGFR